MYFASPLLRNSLWLSVANISTAHVSAYAEMVGSTYGSPNPSFPVDPMPPVTYIFRVAASVHIRRAAAAYGSSPVRTPTSSRDTMSDAQLTACPTASLCAVTGMYDWL